MGKNIVEKILAGHLVSGNLVPGGEIGIRIDQTLTQDATGTMAYLQFEAMQVEAVKTELSVSYIDHNTIQIGLKTRTTTATCKAWRKDSGLCCRAQAMASAIRCIWNGSENQEKR